MRRSLALFAVSALLPIVMLGAVVGTFGFHSQRGAIEHQAQDHARFVATLVGRELFSNMHAVQMIAQSPALDGPIDEKRFGILARRLVADQPLWRLISVASPAGTRLADAPMPIGGVPHGPAVEMESLKRAVATRRPTVGRAMPGRKGHVTFAVRAPVIRDDRVAYVVTTVVEPKAMADLLLNANLPANWNIEVVDQAGNIVARTGSMALLGKPASPWTLAALSRPPGAMYRDRTVDGIEEVATWRPIPNSRWSVHVAMPASIYKAPVVRASGVFFGGIVVSLSLGALLIWLVARDLRQQRLREAAATESQRLEALGRMTGGVAHDFNNLLTPVIGGLDMLQRRMADDPKALRLAEAALQSAERARMLVSRLLAFSRRQALEPRDVDLAALLEGARDLIERSIGDRIELRYRLPQQPPCVRVDPAQLELAILNLAVNARDAMPSGGFLTIATVRERIASRSKSGLAAGDYVKIIVTDTGVGMDEATQAQAIEPFFTTKAFGKGTGLGLSMAHGFAAQSGGRLLLLSAPGMGTSIEIWLPAGEAPAPAGTEAETETETEIAAETAVDTLTANLLLVDDHDLVRRATAGLLREHGHIVIEARSAEEALILLDGDEAFDIIVTDYAMPGRSGVELAHVVRARLPDMPILLITGFAELGDELPPGVGRMSKPFRGAELLARVSSLLAPPEKAARAACC